jgi:hypothetical protein
VGVTSDRIVFSRVVHELLGRFATDPRLLTLIWSNA